MKNDQQTCIHLERVFTKLVYGTMDISDEQLLGGGLLGADNIRKGLAYFGLVAALTPYFKNATTERNKLIESFIGKYENLRDYINNTDEHYFKEVEKLTKELRELSQKF